MNVTRIFHPDLQSQLLTDTNDSASKGPWDSSLYKESNWAFNSDATIFRPILVFEVPYISVSGGLHNQGVHVNDTPAIPASQWGGLPSDCSWASDWLLNSQQKWQDSTSFKPLKIIVYLWDQSTWNTTALEDYISLFPRLALPLSSAEKVDKQ